MALTPWHIASSLSGEEVAFLLAGIDIPEWRAGQLPADGHIHEYKEWLNIIVNSAKHEDLTPSSVEVLREYEDVDSDGENYSRKDWYIADDHSWIFKDNSDLILHFERKEIYLWLRRRGVVDSDIPDALRTQPEAPKPLSPGAIHRWAKGKGFDDEQIARFEQSFLKDINNGENKTDDLNPRKEMTYKRIIAALLALQYGAREISSPFQLADEVLDDCQKLDIKAPASRSTIGDVFKQLDPIQKANLD